MAASYSAPITPVASHLTSSTLRVTDDELAATSASAPERQPSPGDGELVSCSPDSPEEDMQEGDITEELPVTSEHIELRAVEPSRPERRFTFLDPYEQIKSYFSEMTARRVARDPRKRGSADAPPSAQAVGVPKSVEAHPAEQNASKDRVEISEHDAIPNGRYTLKRAPRHSLAALQHSEGAEHTEEKAEAV
ncbi:hypothetical protein PsYK624_012050 [Phanerochaete sordida]|uniref:Uncharacterized protein n=1 Tax=Phanerochaete sordida TaxID=48140 RepID=A0A9P3FZ10_9APHY|nr:hypothetical protein PsYK624_012050 [Phanerochaete sordida]